VRLTGSLWDVRRLHPTYTVELVTGDETFRILEDPDPGRVLTDLRAIGRLVPIPVDPGWGLSDWIPRVRQLPAARAGHGPSSGSFVTAHREIGWTVIGTALVIGFLMVRSVAARLAVDTPAPWVSLWVPAGVVLAMLFTGALVLTSRSSLRMEGGEVVWERSILGIALERTTIDPDRVASVQAVGPVSGHWTHVLVDCDDHVVAVPCPSGDAQDRAREIAAALGAARRSTGRPR
jgi:hypothetical protein